VDGELDGGVKFQLRYDWDTNHGFHVNTTKNGESRHYTGKSELLSRFRRGKGLVLQSMQLSEQSQEL
jgi:hypothetical protein